MRRRRRAITLTAPAPGTGPPRPRLRLWTCVAAAALVAVLGGAVVSSPVTAQDTTVSNDAEVRIVARKLDSGRIEFGLQQRQADNTWGNRQLPRVRFFPTTATVNRWLASSPLDLSVGEARIVARKLESGRIEFGLQQRRTDDSWGDRQLPRVRFFPTTATVNRWLASSPLTLTASRADDGPGQIGDRQATRSATGYTEITGGDAHSCGLHSADTVECWGSNDGGQADAPAGQFRAVAAGGGHSCGLRSDGAITCWGRNDEGQADPPTGQFSTVTAGGGHSCGLRSDGTITCWGANFFGEAEAPGGQFSAVTAGHAHSCGLRSDGTITCWGRNEEWRITNCETDLPAGELPLCDTEWVRTGQADPPAGQFSAVAGGWQHSCGLRSDGTIACWGRNEDGQADPPAGRFRAVAAGGTGITDGGGHSCGLRTDGTIACWGYGGNGQTDAPSGVFTAVSAGGDFSCGVRAVGTIECWGGSDPKDPVLLDAPVVHGNTAQHAAAASDDPMDLPGSPRNVRIDYSEGSRMVVHWKPPTTGGDVSYYFVDARFPGEFFPSVDPRIVRGGPSFVGEVIHRIPARTIFHDGREDYWLVIDYSVVDPDGNRASGDDILGHGAVRVVAVNRDGLAFSDEVLVPSERSRMHRSLRSLVEDMVSAYGDAVPWLGEVWGYITDREQSTDPRYNHQRSKTFVFLDDSLDLGPYEPRPGYAKVGAECHEDILTCGAGHAIAVLGSRSYGDLNTSRGPVKTATHELGHIHTLSNDSPGNPLAIVAGFLYLDRLLRSDPSWSSFHPSLGPSSCTPTELYADLAEFLVLEQVFASDPVLRQFDPSRELGYWSACTPGGSGRPSQEAISIGRSTLSGQIPQWFYDTYQNDDGNYDLDMLWRDVLALDARAQRFAIYALKDHFGGYCADALRQIATFAFSHLDIGNPWRDGGCPEPTAPAGQFSAVSDTCALRADGTVQCWGYNPDGRANPPSGQFATISSGGNHYCGLRNDGTIDCWGNNGDGQTDAPAGQFSTVASGGGRSCGIRTDGTLECWGYLRVDRQTMPTGRLTAVAVGPWHSCVIRVDGTLTCWGHEQFGNIDSPSRAFRAVSVGTWHSCGIRVDDTLECWGSTAHATHGETHAPDGRFLAVSAGGSHSCGLRTDGTLECWGVNEHGQTDAPEGQFTDVSAGGTHTCAVRSDGTLTCWGDNTFGQLGLPS